LKKNDDTSATPVDESATLNQNSDETSKYDDDMPDNFLTEIVE
jgi:hypothetical protein